MAMGAVRIRCRQIPIHRRKTRASRTMKTIDWDRIEDGRHDRPHCLHCRHQVSRQPEGPADPHRQVPTAALEDRGHRGAQPGSLCDLVGMAARLVIRRAHSRS